VTRSGDLKRRAGSWVGGGEKEYSSLQLEKTKEWLAVIPVVDLNLN